MLDKNSGQMDVYNAEIFNMQPLLSGGRCWQPQLLRCFVLLIPALFPWHGAGTIPSLVCAGREGEHSESRVEVEQGVWRVGVTHGVTAQVQPCPGVLLRDSPGTGALNNKKNPRFNPAECFLPLNPG